MEEDKIFFCKKCNYSSNRLTDYKRHLTTSKHKNIVKKNINNKKYVCECGKEYVHMSGLSRHRPICPTYLSIIFANEKYKEDEELTIEKIKNGDNNEIKGMLCNIATQLEEIKQTRQVTTTNNNYVLNLNMFLNENCKNAISLQDFVKQITFVFDDLKDRTWRSRVLLNNLDSLQLEKRPFHCLDTKTQQVVLKNGSEWQKGSTDDIVSTLDSCGRHVQKHFGPKWDLQYPNWANSEKYSKQYMNLWCNITKEPTTSQVEEDLKNVSNKTNLKRHKNVENIKI